MNRRMLLASLIIAFVPFPGRAQQVGSTHHEGGSENTGPVASLSAAQAAVPPGIDARDEDPVWRRAPVVSDFAQLEPAEGVPPSFRTEFRVAYDEENLYVFVRAFDPEPDSILRALSRRDIRGPSDEISLVIDSYHDRRTGFEFAVNPDGVKRDSAIYDDDERDSSWDAVWRVATAVDSLGWTAEFELPLSQLRYPDAATHVFGLGVFREIERYAERVGWPLVSRDRPGLASQLGTLDGLAGLGSSRSIEVTPYIVSKSETELERHGGYGRSGEVSIGSDVKLRLTPNLTVDATVNPDFGQVEADPAVLNLDAFEVFVDEKRPFFVEGTGIYRFALNCYIVVDCNTNEGLFYARRIGREPSLASENGDGSTPTSTPIASAAKLTGRTGGGLSFGVLNAVTRRVEGVGGATAEPTTNHAVLSVQQDFRDGEAGVQFLGTAVNRSLDETSEPFLHRAAYAGALSLRNRFAEGKYEVAGLFAASHVSGAASSIARTQRDAVHYFQQPGDDLEYDPRLTSLSGHSVQLKFGKYGGGITRFETSFVRHSAGFDVNDLGFLKRSDEKDWSTWASLNFNTPTSAYRWLRVNGNVWRTWTTSGALIESAMNFNAHVGLHNNWDLHGGLTVDGLNGSACDRCSRGGPIVRRSRGVRPWFGVNGDNRRLIVPSLWINLSYGDEGMTESVSIQPSVTLRLSTRFEARLGGRVYSNENAAQWVANVTTDDMGTHHLFSRLDQHTYSANVRMSYTATPELTFEFYGEPFVSRGTYSDFRELSDTPMAGSFEERYAAFDPPPSVSGGFRVRQLRTNLVVRWEYLPGSTLFLVWSHGRDASGGMPGDLSWGDEFRDLLELQPRNTFLIKVAHWLNW